MNKNLNKEKTVSEVVMTMTAAYAGASGAFIDDQTSKRLFWTVNKRILACMLGTYFCQSLDKGTLGFASIMGIKKDAHLVGQVYSWLGTILYMGILVGEYPTNLLPQKLPVAQYLAFNCWGVIIACSAAAKNFKALMVVRFLLGIFESCVQPSFIIMTTMWVSKAKSNVSDNPFTQNCSLVHPARTGSIDISVVLLEELLPGEHLTISITKSTRGNYFSSSSDVSLWLGHASSGGDFLTVTWPKCIYNIYFGRSLTKRQDEKRMMIERVRINETGIQNKTYKRYQMFETITDPVIWCYVMLQVTSTLVIRGLGVSSNLIIASFGFSTLQTHLLNIAQGAVTIIVMVGGATLAQPSKQTILVLHTPEKSYGGLTDTSVALDHSCDHRNGSNLLDYADGEDKSRTLDRFLLHSILSLRGKPHILSHLAERGWTNQEIFNTCHDLCSMGSRKYGCPSGMLLLSSTSRSSQLQNTNPADIFQAGDAPRYRKGFTTHFCLYVLFNIFLVILRLLLIRRNKPKRQAAAAALSIEAASSMAQVDQKIAHGFAFDDLTDKENRDFRYVV
ncbi:allantoate permease protein [Rutstroemia sp. NJR-2017a BBW]|nr:allantoate permease protein [Rutstroemia sp. NJR-2017a BBW]